MLPCFPGPHPWPGPVAHQVQATSRALPDGWRPVLPLSADRAAELQQVSLLAAEKYREAQEEIHCKERATYDDSI